jgi:putative intracellular protease/amidase
MATVLIPLPERDFDPTEAAIPWMVLSRLGHHVIFATPDGAPAHADDIMLTGVGLDPWGLVPGLRKVPLFGRLLRANQAGRAAYAAMIKDEAFSRAIKWNDLEADAFDAIVLPGGHRARGMRKYLESPVLQRLVVACFRTDKPVGAICHGALLVARSIDPHTGRSVLYGRKTTALTWQLESSAATLGRYARFWYPDYYRTYCEAPGQPAGYMSVEHEIVRALEHPSDFLDVPVSVPNYRRKKSGLHRDTAADHSASWVVRDRNYVSARWPGDAHAFAETLANVLKAQ